MSIVFATPMFGGQCTKEYFLSCIELERELTRNNIGHTWLVTSNESLIQRARNTAVARFLFDPELKDYKVFMFIDADIQFKAEDVAQLYNLIMEGADVVVAAYPMKREGSDVTAWKDGELVNLDDLKEPTEIDYAGTGFMMIKREVFAEIMQMRPDIRHTEGKIGECWAFFDCGVQNDGDGNFYCSEDYDFCRKWRKADGKIILDPSIRLGHVGRRVYR